MRHLSILTGALALAACAAERTPPAASATPLPERSARYLCADGRAIELLFGGDGGAVLTLAGGEPVPLAAAPAASGARYTGGGWQWWGKTLTEGMLAPLADGETVATAPGVRCRAG